MSGSLSMTIGAAATMLALSPVAGPAAPAVPLVSGPPSSPPSISAAAMVGGLPAAADPRCPYDISDPAEGYRPPGSMKGLLEEAEREPTITVENGHAVTEGGRSGRSRRASGSCIGTGSGSEAVSSANSVSGAGAGASGAGGSGAGASGAGGAGGAGGGASAGGGSGGGAGGGGGS